VSPLCELLAIFGRPYVRVRAHEEYSSSAALVDILDVLTGVLMWDTAPEIHMAAARSLLSFVQAVGFDEARSAASAGAGGASAGTGAPGAPESEGARQSCWDFHQQLLRERNALGALTGALRAQVASFIRRADFGRTRTEELMLSSMRGGRARGERAEADDREMHQGASSASSASAPMGTAGRAGARSSNQEESDGGSGDEERVGASSSSMTSGAAASAHLALGASGALLASSRRDGFAVTQAVRAAAVVRSPDLLTLLVRILRECSEDETNAVILTRSGVAQLCIDILADVQSIRDEVTHTVLETLWNLLEMSIDRSNAAASGPHGSSALSLTELLDKHRDANAAKLLGNPGDIHVLCTLLRECILQGTTQADKEFRNDVLVVSSLVASKPENRPYFAATGFLQLLLDASTAAEQFAAHTGLPLENFASTRPVDLEFKLLAWALIARLVQGSFADFEVEALGGNAGAGASTAGDGDDAVAGASTTCLRVVRSSAFLPTLLLYLDGAAGVENPYLRSWPVQPRRALEVQALQILATVGPAFSQALLDAGALEVLFGYIRRHGGAGGAGSFGGGGTSPRAGGQSTSSTTSSSLSPNAGGLYAFPVVQPGRGGGAGGSGSRGGDADTEYDDASAAGSAKTSSQSQQQQQQHQTGAGRGGVGAAAPRAGVPPVAPPRGRTGKPSLQPGTFGASSRSPTTSPARTGSLGGTGLPTGPDVGRQYWAVRVLNTLCDIGARHDPDAHLSSMLTAGVPTVVAPNGRKPDAVGSEFSLHAAADAGPNGGGGGRPGAPMGHEVAARLGELGLVEELVSLLKRIEAERAPLASSSTASLSGAAGRTGATVSNAATQTIGVGPSTLGSKGRTALAAPTSPTSSASGTGPAEGRKIVEPDLLTEAVLLILASLCSGAADAAAAKAAKTLHHITALTADLEPGEGTAGGGGGSSGGADADGDGENVGGVNSSSSSADGGSGRAGAPPTHVTSTASTDTVHLSLVARLRENQDRLRKCGGLSCLVRYLKHGVLAARNRAGGEFSTSGVRPRVTTATIVAVRAATVGNVRSEARFLADGGVDALLDVAEAAPGTLRPVALTALADLARNPISHVCVRCWRSDLNGESAGVLMLRLWADEEKRLGVVHEPQRGILANPVRPLDGGDARVRQVAIFNATHTPTAAAVKDIVPGGRQALATGSGNNTSKGRRSSIVGETTAFRGLRRALRAAKLWQQVESATPGGPIASLVSAADLRHKIYATLQSVGFNEVEAALAAQVEAQAALSSAAERLAHELNEDEDTLAAAAADAEEAAQFMDAASGSDTQQQQQQKNQGASTASSGRPAEVEAFPDLKPSHKVSLELAKAYPEFVVGAAWDDVRTRLKEMNVEPVAADSSTLLAEIDAVTRVSDRVRQLQAIHANAHVLGKDEDEHAYLARVLDRKTAAEAALKFYEKNKRKPWAQSGKTFVGLTMEERKAGHAARNQMLGRSYIGFEAYPGMPEPTSDIPEGEEGEGLAGEEAQPVTP
jgi:hypothetical protein